MAINISIISYSLKLFLIALASILSSMAFSHAIEVSESIHFYNVKLNQREEVFKSIYKSAPRSHNKAMHALSSKILGEYQPTITIEIEYSNFLFSKSCRVKKADISLHSDFLYPRLKEAEGSHLTKAFQKEFDKIKAHEKQHEHYYIEGLKKLHNEILSLGVNRTDCESLKQSISELEDQNFRALEVQNLKFDCKEYGYRLELNECDRITY